MRIGSPFAGIGGFDLAAEWMGWRTAWFSEVDPYCNALLAERFPGVPNLGDITAIDWSRVEVPDIVCGGFPCQDISYAGKGAGLDGARSGLWWEFARCVREVGPRYVVVENVRALFTRGFDAVLGTLADLGYDAEWAMYGASDVGAPHRRHRVWILAYRNGTGREGRPEPDQRAATRQQAPQRNDPERLRQVVADTGRSGVHERRGAVAARVVGDLGGGVPGDDVSGRGFEEGQVLAHPQRERSQGQQQAGPAEGATDGPGDGRHPCGWAVEPDVGRVAHGVPARVDRLRGLGNAIVPACALPIFRRIEQLEGERLMAAAA